MRRAHSSKFAIPSIAGKGDRVRRLRTIGIFSAGLLCGLFIHSMQSPSASAYGSKGDSGGGIAGGNPSCAADIAPSPDGDDVVNVDDLLAVIRAWGPCPIVDVDGDGWTVAEGDCDDNDPDVFPGAREVCNHIDDDCDTQIDEGAPPDAAEPNDVCTPTTTDLGSVSCDEPGPPLIFSGNLIPAGDHDFVRFLGTETQAGSSEDLLVKVTLAVPADAAAPCLLSAYCSSCINVPASKVVNPGQALPLAIGWTDMSGANNKQILIEVRQNGPTTGECLPYTLTIEGDVGSGGDLMCD